MELAQQLLKEGIPTQAEILSAMGLTELLKYYHAIRKNSNHTLIIEGILVTMYSPRTKLSASVMAIIPDWTWRLK
ncbi:MAG: hypothetical protein CVU87_11360 [Firmicutes bacterium HGW-Firmicutes-12]|jgi:cellulose biosynthesis protein BcsQ|nr:MAG: hypothetical protein CVU87_11360 [Firmicutes bacterium HGW-Firmicutes-12]